MHSVNSKGGSVTPIVPNNRSSVHFVINDHKYTIITLQLTLHDVVCKLYASELQHYGHTSPYQIHNWRNINWRKAKQPQQPVWFFIEHSKRCCRMKKGIFIKFVHEILEFRQTQELSKNSFLNNKDENQEYPNKYSGRINL